MTPGFFALMFWALLVGVFIGIEISARYIRPREPKTIRLQSSTIMITLGWADIEKLLDSRGLVATPKGVDFSGKVVKQ